tara:strand:+ start:2322 stop:2777 length:456 start_codon:yes stop_codon:yes gene_type:complete
MTTNIFAVAIINAEGDIDRMYHPGAYVDPEGTYLLDKGKNVIHLKESVNIPNFKATRYWDEGWKAREPKNKRYWIWKDKKWNLNSTELMNAIRDERNSKMAETDIYLLADYPIAADKLAEWKTYRQALRDVPANNSSVTDPSQVKWPTKPT